MLAPKPTPDCAVVIALHDGCRRRSREGGPSLLLLPMSGIQEGEEGRRTRSEWIKGIAWARPLSLAGSSHYRVSEARTPFRPLVIPSVASTPPGNRNHLYSPHSPAIPNCISLCSSAYLSETECARGDGGGGDNEDDMILSGPARPKSDPEEEEGRTDGRRRTTSGSVRFDAWAFTPVGR